MGREVDLLRCRIGDAQALQLILEAIDRAQRPPMLKDLRLFHGLTLQQVATEARVPTRTALVAEIGGPVEQQEARRLLDAVNRLTDREYAFEQIWFSLKPDSSHGEQQTQPLPPRSHQ